MTGYGGGALSLINGCRRHRALRSLSITRSIYFSGAASSVCRAQAHKTCSATTTIMSSPPEAHHVQLQGRKLSSLSPFQSNILRILRREIQYQSDYAPPRQPIKEFGRFVVEDRPGERWVTLRGTSAEDENIKIEATMFDGSIKDSNSGDERCEENMRLHISLLVDIGRGEGSDLLEFVCSAWHDLLEIQKVYIFRRDATPAQPYMGPDIGDLSPLLRTGFYQFLKARGIDDGLSEFLHEYMMNKDRIELINWLGKVQSYFNE